MAKFKYRTPSGVNDILPFEQQYYKKVHKAAEELATFYNFGEITTPIFEHEELFTRGIGNATEVVQKQMYRFKTRGGYHFALRPEFTAGIARSYLQHGMHNLPQPVKLWTYGSLYRYERPQAGRYRQFHQVDFEVLGDPSPVVDAQMIRIFLSILEKLKIKNLVVEVNSIGDNQCRPYYRKQLVSALRSQKAALCADCKKRLMDNPLRVLDCKQEKCQRVVRQAPQMVDHLCKECKAHFTELLEFLDEMEIPYTLNPYLVRGLDYYTKTVFEIFTTEGTGSGDDGSSRNALAGGGRYDSLVKLISNKEIPGCGAALGVERVVDLLREKDAKPQEPKADVFLAQLGKLAKRKSLLLLEEFRASRIKVSEALGKDSLKGQLRAADRAGAKYVLILGQKEAMEEKVLVRDMKTGRQSEVKLTRVVSDVKRRLSKKK